MKLTLGPGPMDHKWLKKTQAKAIQFESYNTNQVCSKVLIFQYYLSVWVPHDLIQKNLHGPNFHLLNRNKINQFLSSDGYSPQSNGGEPARVVTS